MYLTERHSIKKRHNKALFVTVDSVCYASKNLYNAANYIISQANHISYRLKQGEILESWEKEFIKKLNCAIKNYNEARPDKKPLAYIDEKNGIIANAYFLSWYLKNTREYKALYSTCSQMCIQTICKNWKSYYMSLRAFSQGKLHGFPSHPGYLDKVSGRNWINLTYQNIHIDDNSLVHFPKFLGDLTVKALHRNIKQARIITRNNKIVIELIYEKEVPVPKPITSNARTMGIDLGVNNLAAVASNTEVTSFIISGRPLKSMNQWFNKERARLTAIAKVTNHTYKTKRLQRLSERRNNKVKDAMRKVSRYIVNFAKLNNIDLIVIGHNKDWKQDVNLDYKKHSTQNFVSIPFNILISMIQYKAELEGISVRVVEESYTSGTSYLDNELPSIANYDKSRREHRGLFISNTGIPINADINAAYQMMKKADISVPIKLDGSIPRINVA